MGILRPIRDDDLTQLSDLLNDIFRCSRGVTDQ